MLVSKIKTSNKEVIAKNHLTNLYEMNSSSKQFRSLTRSRSQFCDDNTSENMYRIVHFDDFMKLNHSARRSRANDLIS